MTIAGKPLIAGETAGKVLKLTAPACFWGGLDAATGTLTDPRHPQTGESIADRIVAIPAIVGSSASSQFLLEAIHLGNAPRAILLGEAEVIIATAVLVGRELGYADFPIIHCDIESLQTGDEVAISADGQVRVTSTEDAD